MGRTVILCSGSVRQWPVLCRREHHFHRRRWFSGQTDRLLPAVHDFANAALQLRVASLNLGLRIIVDLDIRIHSVSFYDPFATLAGEAGPRHKDVSTIN